MTKKETLIKFYTEYRLYIFPAIVIISSLILIVFIILPQISKLIANNRAEEDLKVKHNFLEIKVQALENYDAQDLIKKVDFALSSYPADKDFGNVIGLIQNLTAQSGFILSAISLGNQGAKVANAQSFTIKLDATGPRRLLSILFSNVETSSRLMRVGNIDVISTSDQQVVNVSMNIDVLYSPAPQSFGSVDSPLPEISQKEEELITKLAKNITPSLFSSTNISLPSRGRANPFE